MYRRYRRKDAAMSQGTARAARTRANNPARSAKRRKALVAGALAATTVVCAAAFFLAPAPTTPDAWYDGNAIEGSYEGKAEEDIRADLERRIEEGMMNISIASNVIVSSQTGLAALRIENVPGNPIDQKVVVTLDETGETLYQSGALAPGTCIQEAPLAAKLPVGSHEATATFVGYDPQTHEPQGTSAAKITLTVE